MWERGADVIDPELPERVCPVALFVTVTTAPPMTALVVSVIVPLMPAVPSCAYVLTAKTSNIKIAAMEIFLDDIDPLLN